VTFPIHMFEYTSIVLIVPSPNKMERRAGIRLSRNHESSRRYFVFFCSRPVVSTRPKKLQDVLHRCTAQMCSTVSYTGLPSGCVTDFDCLLFSLSSLKSGLSGRRLRLCTTRHPLLAGKHCVHRSMLSMDSMQLSSGLLSPDDTCFRATCQDLHSEFSESLPKSI